jgi:hypothetical protein
MEKPSNIDPALDAALRTAPHDMAYIQRVYNGVMRARHETALRRLKEAETRGDTAAASNIVERLEQPH